MDGGALPANAPSTNPASLGENTASPSYTWRIAPASSVGGIDFRHVAAGAGPDHRDHVLGRVRDAEREEPHVGAPLDHAPPTAVGQVHVQEHHVRFGLEHAFDRVLHGPGMSDELVISPELGPDPAREERGPRRGTRGSRPSPRDLEAECDPCPRAGRRRHRR